MRVLLIALLAALALGCQEPTEEPTLYGILRIENIGLDSYGAEIDGVDTGVVIFPLGGFYEKALEEGDHTVTWWPISSPATRKSETFFLPGGLKLSVSLVAP